MTATEHRSQQAEQAAAAPHTASPDAEYKVGPGRPPKEYRWQPGQSGNPKGAKRKAPTLAPDLKKLLEQMLERKITLTQGEKTRTLTLFAAGMEQLVKQYVKGDRHARQELLALAQQVGLNLLGIQKNAVEEAFSANHHAILEDYLLKQYDRLPPRQPVIAPPALLDDDTDDQKRG